MKCSLEVTSNVDEKHGIFDVVFLAEFSEKVFGESGCRGNKQPEMELFVRVWISSGVQPKLLVVDANHCVVNRNLIRFSVTGRL